MPAVENGLNLTLDHMENPFKITIVKRIFLHVREDQKPGTEPIFHAPRGPQMAKIRVDNRKGINF